MQNKFFNVELVNTNNHSYILNCSMFKRISNFYNKNKTKDPFEQDYNKALLKWESVALEILSGLCTVNTKRILKYSSKSSGTQYREIDLISQQDNFSLVFCELKLKSTFKEKQSNKRSGWHQLIKSIEIASTDYNVIGGVAINIDLSEIYGIKSQNNAPTSYSNIQEVSRLLKCPGEEKHVVWLDGNEFFNTAVQLGLLKSHDLEMMGQLYREYKNPLSTIDNLSTHIPNNLFG